MEPSATRITQPWLHAPGPRAVMAALGGKARFVGGCVRDALAGRPVHDIDLATPLPPEAVMTALREAAIKAVPTGIDHGTVTAVYDHQPFEITTLRRDVETDGRRATVAFTDDWVADAQRRDFTFNALYCDADGTVYDPVGGLADLHAHRVRFIGAPLERIGEDALRILRFFRFHAWYGTGAIDTEGLAACRARADDLAILSGERVAMEMTRLLAAPAPLETLEIMRQAGVLDRVLPEASQFGRFGRLVRVENRIGQPDAIRRLGALIDGDEPAARALCQRWRRSNKITTRLLGMARPHPPVHPRLDERAARRLLYELGRERFVDLTLLAWADHLDGPDDDEAGWRALLARAEHWTQPEFTLRGGDVMAHGIASGPKVGAILKQLENWWIDQDFAPGRAATLAELDRLVAAERKKE